MWNGQQMDTLSMLIFLYFSDTLIVSFSLLPLHLRMQISTSDTHSLLSGLTNYKSQKMIMSLLAKNHPHIPPTSLASPFVFTTPHLPWSWARDHTSATEAPIYLLSCYLFAVAVYSCLWRVKLNVHYFYEWNYSDISLLRAFYFMSKPRTYIIHNDWFNSDSEILD